MAPHDDPTFDAVAWVRRVNARWIVHQGLRESAAAYLDYLQREDPGRLVQSCRNARRLVAQGGSTNDPKPWFYAGLFSLVGPVEAEEHLRGHWFTAACIPALPEAFGAGMAPEAIGTDTRAKVDAIREAVAGLRGME